MSFRDRSVTVKGGTSSPNESGPAKKKGRPPGSKNKKTLEREALASVNGEAPKRGKGRPPGSKNKKDTGTGNSVSHPGRETGQA